MVQTRLMATNPGHEESGNAFLQFTFPENQSRGTTLRRVSHLEKEMDQMRKVMDEMRENIRRVNPVDDLVH